ncbi:MAG: BMP family ABC transporter substrate-binding protein [Succinivibrio sp.]|nr:BMP family ABC transporter substrate-binding protein [Succinivibrio sp.]
MPKIDLIRSDQQFKYVVILIISACCLLLFVFLLMLGLSTATDSALGDKPKLGFVILGDVNEKGWNSIHYEGIREACNDFNVELLLKDNVRVNSGICPKAVQDLVEEGAQMIFLASSSYATEIKDMLPGLRHIAFATNAETIRARNITSYVFRMYQGRYLAGVLAGMQTKSNVVGYVAAHRNSEVNRGINAFTLGVRSVNPHAQVVVLYTDSWQNEVLEEAHAEILITQCKADVLTYHQDDHTVARVAEKYGVDYISCYQVLESTSEHNLGAVICRLDKYYRNIVQRFLKGELNAVPNSWQGIEADLVDLKVVSSKVTAQMREKLAQVKNDLKKHLVIFSGEIYDNLGVLHCTKHESISDKALMDRIDWLVDGCLELN